MKKFKIYKILTLTAILLFSSIGAYAFFFDDKSDWDKRCAKSAKDNVEKCEIYQKLVEPKSKMRVAEMAIYKMPQSEKYNSVLLLPLGINLPSGALMQIDGKEVGRAIASHCTNNGCAFNLDLSKNDIVGKMIKGKELKIFFATSNGKTLNVTLSLTGFKKALSEIS